MAEKFNYFTVWERHCLKLDIAENKEISRVGVFFIVFICYLERSEKSVIRSLSSLKIIAVL